MMWDFSGGAATNVQHPPAMQMPSPSYPTPEAPGSSSVPFPGPSPYPAMPDMTPTYIPAPQFERSIYYGHAPPPPPHHNRHHAPSYSYETYTGGVPQPEYYVERVRANSHSHSHPHGQPHTHTPHGHAHAHTHTHAHSHSHSRPPPPPAAAPQPSTHRPHQEHKPSSHQIPQTMPQDPLNPNFQYSKCTGRKKALCIGINYKGQSNELRGCINDARHVREFLMRHHGYRDGDIVILSDDARKPRQIPTRRNIIDAMKWLVRSARTDDSLFFHYSGHGGQTKDVSGDEVDGFDEVIYPVDFKQNGHILDDEMHAIMVKPLPPGCRLTALFDSCHSGTVLDLPYIYSSHGRLKGSHVSDRMRKQLASPADVISWSGCKDGQTSADTFAGGVAVGAMSYAFITTLTRNPKQSYQELLKSIRLILHPRFSQKPQLGSSHHIDTSLRFVL